jgi:cytochrome c biogenesis protein CcdA
MDIALIIPAFIAGLLTFLAPCTLPLVPGYLGFISGVSAKDLQDPIRRFQRCVYCIGQSFRFGRRRAH